jgi:hypothetical protein
MDDLVSFLAARLDEDEAAALACQTPGPWVAATHPSVSWIVTGADGDCVVSNEGSPTPEEAAHIARHDPARVLREVAAKRAIVASYEDAATHEFAGLQVAVGHLAAAYGEHPDYRPEWAPEP